MAIPDYQSMMLPVLKYMGDGQEHSLHETIEVMAEKYGLTEQERSELLPSGRARTFDNRIGWVRTYLKKAGLLESTRRGCLRITKRGHQVLASSPAQINIGFLKQFPEFADFQKPAAKTIPSEPDQEADGQNPEETIESAYSQIRQALADEVLESIKGCSPAFFERLVVDLVLKMGYGGTRKDAGQAIGKSGDGGIDGIINEDRLGLDTIYIQAKRWDGNVSRPEVQKFAGALLGNQAKKGIFITTSAFTAAAREYAAHLDSKIILINGAALAELMIDYNVGVATVAAYELKRIDTDYFLDE